MNPPYQYRLRSFTTGPSWEYFTKGQPPSCPLQKMPMEILTKICRELADNRGNLAQLGCTIPLVEAYSQATIWAFHNVIQRLFGLTAFHVDGISSPVRAMAVVCLAPNLSTLELTVARRWGDTNFLLDKVDNRVTGPKPTCALPNLRNLVVRFAVTDNTGWTDGINLHSLNGLLHCAKYIESLTVERPRGGTSLTCRLPNLTCLRLIDSFLCHRGLQFLLRKCDKLTHFEFSNFHDGWAESYLPVSPAQVVECLALAKGTLQKLHLAPWNADPAKLDGRAYELLTSLDGFVALKQLAIDQRALVPDLDNDRALCRLVWNCPLLEGLYIMGLGRFPTEEVANLTNAKVMLLRLAKIKLEVARGFELPARAYTDLQRHLSGDINVAKMRQAGVEVVGVAALEDPRPFAG
ncbi:hypothetical protein B0I37DRAFT_419403 [Chaetomium sp. MPI-CAGE-AT-0009]|nr:hypothetical protein B0I37DRAFT_419403 [Chaetomium sp. MPI-CAGE-AT-0009]